MLVRIPFLILFISFSFIGIGQISFQETVLKLYPEIEIRFNYRDPSGIDTNKVRFYESGKMIEKYHLSKQDSAKNIYKRKQVLILIENSYWSRFESQREAVKIYGQKFQIVFFWREMNFIWQLLIGVKEVVH